MQGRLVAPFGLGFALFAVFAIGCAGGDGPSGPPGSTGPIGATGPTGPSGFIAAINANDFPICSPPVTGFVTVCPTATGYTAGANQTALVQVSVSSQIPASAAAHALGVWPMVSTDAGVSWSKINLNDQVAGNQGANTAAQYVSATNTATLALVAGTTYLFAGGVWDRPGGGWGPAVCPCSTTVMVAVHP